MKKAMLTALGTAVMVWGSVAPAAADYLGCVVNKRDAVVEGSLVDTFDNDSFGFTTQPHETVCFEVLQEGTYTARTSDGFELGTLSVNDGESFDYQGKKVYWIVEIDPEGQ